MKYAPVNFQEKFAKFSEQWSPRIIARMNDYHLKLVRLKGEFVWHRHQDTDEVFIVLEGEMRIEFRDGQVDLAGGELFVVPRGIEHRPVACHECKVLLVEPESTVNTGDTESRMTADNTLWV